MSLSVKSPEVKFERYAASPPTKINMTVDSLAKDGKTRFALTAPGPTAYHDFDFGLHGVADKFPDLELYHFPYQFPATLRLPGTEFSSLSEAAGKIWTEFITNVRASVERCRTVVVDTGTKTWDLIRLARLGKLTQVLPVQYTAVNAEYNELIQQLHRSKANIIWLHRLKAKYEDDKKTGEFERSGYNDMAFEVDTVLRLSYDESKKGEEGFRAKIGNCRPNRLLQGTEIVGADISFPKLGAILYPATSEETWK